MVEGDKEGGGRCEARSDEDVYEAIRTLYKRPSVSKPTFSRLFRRVTNLPTSVCHAVSQKSAFQKADFFFFPRAGLSFAFLLLLLCTWFHFLKKRWFIENHQIRSKPSSVPQYWFGLRFFHYAVLFSTGIANFGCQLFFVSFSLWLYRSPSNYAF
mmetsp:Transcript_19654/g.48963  ORF Transcript_19654/g.48963 Transcript_19654/m.48963 type:complete len:155 (+) Transcript_19654:31-495(+)